MFVVQHAGVLYGPFRTADDAADFAVREHLADPWQIMKLHPPMSEGEKVAILEKWKAGFK